MIPSLLQEIKWIGITEDKFIASENTRMYGYSA